MRRLKTVRRPPIYPKTPGHLPCSPHPPPSAALTPRGVGNKLADRHIKLARVQEQALEDKDLAYFMEGTVEFNAYVSDMLWAQSYALENRELMLNAALADLFAFAGTGRELGRINCHHNFAQRRSTKGAALDYKEGGHKGRQRRYGGHTREYGDSLVCRPWAGGDGVLHVVKPWGRPEDEPGPRLSGSLPRESLIEAMKGRRGIRTPRGCWMNTPLHIRTSTR